MKLVRTLVALLCSVAILSSCSPNGSSTVSSDIPSGNVSSTGLPEEITIRNPLVDHEELGNFYGDPEIRYFEGKYWIYSTTSMANRKQTNMDVFYSEDLQTWTRKKDIIKMSDFPQTTGCIWAPSVIKRGEYYYLSFSINDIQTDSTTAGLMMARSKNPDGPFEKYFDGPLIGRYIYGAQPIDANFFEDDDGTLYFYYGGHANCNVGILNDTMDGFIPFETILETDTQKQKDEKTFKSMTKSGNMGAYVEGSFMVKRNGKYYLMWSVGSYVNATYGVEYGIGDSPLGPFTYQSKILQTDMNIASGPGHHSCIYIEEYDRWLMCYHRRNPDAKQGTDRRLCIDIMEFDENGNILPIVMTNGFTIDKNGGYKLFTEAPDVSTPDASTPDASTPDTSVEPGEKGYIEKNATASASFTKLSGMLAKLNDGIDSGDNRWTEHTNTADSCAWIEYKFDGDIKTDKIEIKWFDDASELITPTAIKIEYLDNGTLKEVEYKGDYAFTGNVYNVYGFTEITTDTIRITPTRAEGTNKYVGINEWKVYGTVE